MGYPPPPQNPYGPQHPQQPPYGPVGYPPPQPSKSSRDALVVLLAIGVPLLLLGGVAAVVMVLTDTGRSSVITEADGPTMVMPSSEPLSSPPVQGDPAIQPPVDAAGQGTTADLAVQPPPAGGASQPAVVGGASQPAAGGSSQPPQGQTGTTATVGGSITLQGIDPGLKMTVTLNRLVNPATSANQFSKPKTGNKFVAVEVTLANSGQAVYSSSPTGGVWLIDGELQQHRPSYQEVSEGQGFGGNATINVGDSRKGMIVFEVPETARLTKFQFGLDGGFADQKGEWTLS
ncbi:DUF4352 domain-containing protein [Nonomuraea sp. NPDC050404]|uniref:DUF4352 domain-containing protein n=1 Tax=Nonomuraea sp. NPDC050404 TaxID=3155783 RepID=UPI0033E507C4